MLLTIVRKEIVSHVLSLRFGVTFILFILLVFTSIYVTTNEYKRDVGQFSARQRESSERIKEILQEEDARRRVRRLVSWEGRTDPSPVPPLSCIVQGLRPTMPVAVNTTDSQSQNIGRGLDSNPLAGLLRIPDLVYVVSIVLSLLAVLFAFDSICGERESGTLRLMLSNAVPRDSILLGKWLGGYVVLIVPFLIAAIGGFGYAWRQGSLRLTGENLQRLGALLLVACLYISVFFTLSLFVSTLTRRSVTALFICLFIWVLWVLVIPNLAPVLAKILVFAPSVEKINAEKRAVDVEIRLRMARVSQITGELGYGRKSQQQRENLRQEGERRKRRWDRFLAKATKDQTELAQTLGKISPAVCWTYSAVALADSGPRAYAQFRQAQQRLREAMRDLSRRARDERRKSGEYPVIEAGDVPQLQVAAPGFGAAVKDTLNNVLILAILNVVFFMSAFVAFLRCDVR